MIPKREDALILVDQYLKLDNLKKHVFATEAIMRALAKRLGKDEDLWGIVGLLHDLDYEETKNHAQRHGLVTEQTLRDKGINGTIIEAIKAHNAEALNIDEKPRWIMPSPVLKPLQGSLWLLPWYTLIRGLPV